SPSAAAGSGQVHDIGHRGGDAPTVQHVVYSASYRFGFLWNDNMAGAVPEGTATSVVAPQLGVLLHRAANAARLVVGFLLRHRTHDARHQLTVCGRQVDLTRHGLNIPAPEIQE